MTNIITILTRKCTKRLLTFKRPLQPVGICTDNFLFRKVKQNKAKANMLNQETVGLDTLMKSTKANGRILKEMQLVSSMPGQPVNPILHLITALFSEKLGLIILALQLIPTFVKIPVIAVPNPILMPSKLVKNV